MEELLKDYIARNLKPSLFGVKELKSVSIKKLASGCYNIIYLLNIGSKRFALRVGIHSDEFEGKNLEEEYKILKKLKGLHCPKAIVFNKKSKYPFIIEENIEGEKILKLSPKIVGMIAKALAEVHLSLSKKGKASIKDFYMETLTKSLKIIKKNAKMYNDLKDYVLKAEESIKNKESLFQKYSKNVLIHGDMHCGNILLRDNQIIFLDWESSGINDPVFDIVAFFYESENQQHFNKKESITNPLKELFLKEYLKINPDKHLREKLSIVYPLRWLADTLWLARRIIDYESIPKDSNAKTKEKLIRLYKLNLSKLKELWK